MKNLSRYIRKYISYPILMAIVCALLAIIVVVQNITIAKVLDIMLTKAHSSLALPVILGILLCVLILRALLNMTNQLLGTQLAYKVKTHLRERAIAKNSHQPIGEQMSVITESIDGLRRFIKTICRKSSKQS